MKQIPVWIDCDPGVDDAAALLTAQRLPELKIVAVCCECRGGQRLSGKNTAQCVGTSRVHGRRLSGLSRCGASMAT